MLRFNVLGPVTAERDRTPIDLGARKQKSVLAVLISEIGNWVETDRIIQAVWGEGASPSRRRSVQTYMSALRRTLGDDQNQILLSDKRGYLLSNEGVEADWVEFEAYLESGSADNHQKALSLWRGSPFQDVENDWSRPLATSWEEKRLFALEGWASSMIEAGRASGAIVDLEQALSEHPMRESLCEVLMHAQVAAGRPADALMTFRRLRLILVEEMGVEPSAELRAMEEQILLDDTASLRSPPPTGSVLPPDRTPLIGRDEELDAVLADLEGSRLVSLLGPGGSGKTRLAIAAARRSQDERAVAVYFVDLSRLSRSDHVPLALAAALGVSVRRDEDAGTSALEQVVRSVSSREVLILIDNCEHVIDAARQTINALLQVGPGVNVLATSREALGVEGEVRHQVAGLSLTDGTTSPAMDLLLARARAVNRGFSPDTEDIHALEKVCVTLDGMPLAIELAAAQLAFLSPGDLLEGLSDRLPMAGGPGREERHRTLQATMEWSWALLNLDEQRLLSELSVFAGGWTLAAAQGVCTGGSIAIRTLLGGLVTKSLVLAEHNHWGARYRMLDTIRLYARTHLAHDIAELESRHAAWFSQWCRSYGIEEHWTSGELASRMLHDSDNLRTAHMQRLASDDVEGATWIVSAHLTLWRATHAAKQSLEWTGAIETSRLSPEAMTHWLLARATALQVNDRFPEMWALADEAAGIAREIERDDLLAVALATSAFGYLTVDLEANREKWETVSVIARSTGLTRVESGALSMRAIGSLLNGDDPDTYGRMLEQAAGLVGASGWDMSLFSLARLLQHIATGDPRASLAEQRDMTTTSEKLGITLEAARFRLGVAHAAAHVGEKEALQEALRWANAVFEMAWGSRASADVLLGYAAWEVLQGDPYLGSELLAAVRGADIEYPECVIHYVMVRDRLLALDLDADRLAVVRARGAGTSAPDALARRLSTA